MATKKFKKLPKDSQRAAFAQMDEDGTRQNRGGKSGGGVVAKTLKPSAKKLPHIKTGEQRAILESTNYAFSKKTASEKKNAMVELARGELKAKDTIRRVRDYNQKDFFDLKDAKKSKEFLGAARAFRIGIKSGKKK